jgi:SAM-dependent methyltransferase
MIEVSWATPLYEFLRQCNQSPLPKVVLDCGAGGNDPAIALFHRHGYRTYGVEISDEALEKATAFCRSRGMVLNVFRGDMRRLPFPSRSLSFAYAFYSMFFMLKPDIVRSVNEIERVLVPGGLCFVNIRSVDDPDDRRLPETSPARLLLGTDRFSKHADNEADTYFANFEILRKEKRIEDKVHGSSRLVQAYVDYIARKR